MSKSGIVNVRMVITEEKILMNIDKVQKLINPKSKKQIVQLEDDTYFKDLVESIKTYLIEYPKKKNFPASVYKAAYGLVEFATNQFEENTKKIEELINELKKDYTIIIVTHNIQQATRVSDYTAFFMLGEVIECDKTIDLFSQPKNKKTEDYITGRFG